MDEESTLDHFTFFKSYFDAGQFIKNPGDRCKFYDTIIKYALLGIEPDTAELPDQAASALVVIKPFLEKGRKRAFAGKRGGTTKQTASKDEANVKQTASKSEANTKQPASNINRIEIEEEIEIDMKNEGEREGAGREAAAAFAELNGGEDGQRAEQDEVVNIS